MTSPCTLMFVKFIIEYFKIFFSLEVEGNVLEVIGHA
jgi:hypothetical protein